MDRTFWLWLSPGLILAAGIFSPAAPRAQAFTPTVMANGKSVRWKGPDIKLNMVGNSVNQSGISDTDFRAAVVRSLQRWQSASAGRIGFDYWQGTDRSTYIPNSELNGQSSIYFASNATSDPHLSQNVIGLTQVWYNTDTGAILETDVVLNDLDFRFTTDSRDTSGFGSSQAESGGSRSSVFIENVVSHELGHALGLSHSGGLQSTMLYMESPEQAHLGCDEQIGVRALYPTGDSSQRGQLTGSVLSPSGTPVFGAQVEAISRRRGTVLATALTDPGGNFTIDALEPGAYFLMAEPFSGGADALPGYYSGIRAGLCRGQSFSRTLLSADPSGAVPEPVFVTRGHSARAPSLVVSCPSGADATGARSTGATLYEPALDGSGFGYLDRLPGGATAYYPLKALAGHVELHVLSYSLYSPIETELALVGPDGRAVGRATSAVYIGDSGYINHDSAVTADGLAPGDYTLQVLSRGLDVELYPAGPLSLDPNPFILITGSINEPRPALASTIPMNARCRMNESFSNYRSPAGEPARGDAASDGSGFCGTIGVSGEGKGPRPGAASIIGWLLPWLAMGGAVRLARSRARTGTPLRG